MFKNVFHQSNSTTVRCTVSMFKLQDEKKAPTLSLGKPCAYLRARHLSRWFE